MKNLIEKINKDTRLNICLSIMIAGVLSLFGSLIWTAVSGNSIPFIFGYPVATVLLIIAKWFR